MAGRDCIFAENLVSLRKKKGVFQRDLAEKLGVSVQAVSSWESGVNSPHLSTLYLLCDALQVSMSGLLGCQETTEESHSEFDKGLIEAYRGRPDLQKAVRRLLELE